MRGRKGGWLITCGILLILAAVCLVLAQRYTASKNRVLAAEAAAALTERMPPVQEGIPGEHTDLRMPAVEWQNADYVGILEVPDYSCTLPIGGTWQKNKVTRYPCRFSGSAYGGCLVIGGSSQPGQLDFVQAIQNGDPVYVTDLTGGRFGYQVTQIRQTKDVSYENLTREGDLVLFARNSYSLDYTVIRCERTH